MACVEAVSNPIDLIQYPEPNAEASLLAGLPSWITPEFVVETQQAWTPIYGYAVTQEEAIEIIQTFNRLTDILED